MTLFILAAVLSATGCANTPPRKSEHSLPTISVHMGRTLTGHSGQLWDVAFTPDSQWLATASVDSTVRIWRVTDGSLARTLRHPAVTGEAAMVGEWGHSLTAIGPGRAGRVATHGEIWQATSAESIPEGARVRITQVDGLLLTVHRE